MKAIAELRQGLSEGWKSLAEGWDDLRRRAGSAMTRFRRDGGPAAPADEDDFILSSPRWGMLAGEVFEDDDRVVVRLEAPGMDVKDFDIEVRGDLLRLTGQKRSVRESGSGTWRLAECAYGRFERSIRLPGEVVADKASASYRRGILRVELPKRRSAAPRRVQVKVA